MPTPDAPATASERLNDRQRRQVAAQLRAQLKPLRDAVKQAEATLEKTQRQLAGIEAKLTDPTLYESTRKEDLKRLLLDKARCTQDIDDAESAWLSHMEQLEHAERASALD